jgi:hypothetical protein
MAIRDARRILITSGRRTTLARANAILMPFDYYCKLAKLPDGNRHLTGPT